MNMDLQARQIKPLRQTFTRVMAYTGDKPASRYLEVTLDTQPHENFHYRPTWEPQFELFDPRRSAIQMADWNSLRDPRQFYYATWTMTRARQQEALEASYQFVESRGMLARMSATLLEHVMSVLMPLRHVAWGGNMNNCNVCSRGYGSAFTAPSLMHAMDHLGVAQYLTRLGMAVEDDTLLERARTDWLNAPVWQPLRRYVEDSFVIKDPFECFVAQNVALDGQLYPLIYQHFIDDHLAREGDASIAMLTSFMPEWHKESARWIDAVLKTAAAESDANRQQLQQWVQQYAEQAAQALQPVAELALADEAATALAQSRAALAERLKKAGLQA